MLTYLLENVLPNLEQIKIEGNDSIQLEFLRIVADLAPHCGDFENPHDKLQPLYDRLMVGYKLNLANFWYILCFYSM